MKSRPYLVASPIIGACAVACLGGLLHKSGEVAGPLGCVVAKATGRPVEPARRQSREGAKKPGVLDLDGMKAYPSIADDRDGDFVEAFHQLVIRDRARAREVLEKYAGDHARRDVETLFGIYGQTLARIDPVAAIDWAKGLSDPALSNLMISQAFFVISQEDDAKALSLIGPYINRQWAVGTISGCLQSLAKRSPSVAMDWIDGNLRDYPNAYFCAVAAVMTATGEREPAALLGILSGYDLGSKGDDVLRGSIYGIATRRMEAGIEFVRLLEQDSPFNTPALAGLVDACLSKAPDEITALVAARGGTDAGKILAGGFANWLANDLSSASEWLDAQPKALQRDLANHGIVGVAAAASPRDAIRLVDRMECEEAEKTIRYREIVQQWGESSPSESLEWIASLSAAQQRATIGEYVDAVCRVDVSMVAAFLDSRKIDQDAKTVAMNRLRLIEERR